MLVYAFLIAAATWVGGVGLLVLGARNRSACCLLTATTAVVLAVPLTALSAVGLLVQNVHSHPGKQVFLGSVGPGLLLAASIGCLGRYLWLERDRVHRDRHAADLLSRSGRPHPEIPGVLVLPTSRDLAFTLPASRLIVISESVVGRPLDEVRSVLAHEQAHLRGRHHIYPQLATALSWLLPPRMAQAFVTWVNVCVEASADCQVRRLGLGAALSRTRRSWSGTESLLLEQGIDVLRSRGSTLLSAYVLAGSLLLSTLFVGAVWCVVKGVS